jgi:hypothetical protein
LTPQAPQLASSALRFTHAPPQSVAPAVQVILQLPMLQTAVAVPPSPTMARQLLVQEPQWSRSVLKSTQTPEQLLVPPGQPQAPFEQTWPAGQIFPQVPQLLGSLAVETQAPPHEVWPEAQVLLHRPPVQTDPSAHEMPHRPQCRGSLVRFAHWGGEPHETLPTGQPQVLLAQTMPPVQRMPQPPQLFESEVRSTQALPQFLSGVAQLPVQPPW